MASGECLELMRGHEGPIWSMQYDGRRVASCDDEGAVRLWDLETHRCARAAAALCGGARGVCALLLLLTRRTRSLHLPPLAL